MAGTCDDCIRETDIICNSIIFIAMEIKGNEIIAGDGKWVYRKTDTRFETPIKKATIFKGETTDDFDEYDEVQPVINITDYNDRVNDLIRERYSLSEELAILRQRDTKPEEFATYNAFAEECKAKVREERIW